MFVNTSKIMCWPWQDEDESARTSPIPEEEEVEEDLVPAMESLSLERKLNKQIFKPTDTIVLELSAPPGNRGRK